MMAAVLIRILQYLGIDLGHRRMSVRIYGDIDANNLSSVGSAGVSGASRGGSKQGGGEGGFPFHTPYLVMEEAF